MGVYNDNVLPRLVDVALGRRFDPIRARVAHGLHGDVLEVGFGSGRNVPHLPSGVTRMHAVDPAVSARRLAVGRVAASTVPVDYIGLDGARLALPDASVDHVLSTWTLCTIADVEGALAEIYRVLRPNGSLHFIEHGRSPSRTISTWQRRLTPPWRKVAGGCHLDRPIATLIESSGMQLTRLDSYRLFRPELLGWTYEGVA
ncbi:MAG: class I SAM-dependent methyltransferase, partial [Actinomycetota bacterium]|nr:class I SAM-dependent methyltransferase [Actinomycetota bacterium]